MHCPKHLSKHRKFYLQLLKMHVMSSDDNNLLINSTETQPFKAPVFAHATKRAQLLRKACFNAAILP
jgi:hypothetical protein